MTLFSFEKLDVYHLAKGLVVKVYTVSKLIPSEERYCLVSQLHRAAISVVSNIAEGSARMSSREQSHFYQMAYGSLMEVACQLDICHDLGYLESEKLESLRIEIEKIPRMMSALRSSRAGLK